MQEHDFGKVYAHREEWNRAGLAVKQLTALEAFPDARAAYALILWDKGDPILGESVTCRHTVVRSRVGKGDNLHNYNPEEQKTPLHCDFHPALIEAKSQETPMHLFGLGRLMPVYSTAAYTTSKSTADTCTIPFCNAPGVSDFKEWDRATAADPRYRSAEWVQGPKSP